MYILLSCAALQTSADIPAEVINKKEKAVSLVRKTFKKNSFWLNYQFLSTIITCCIS